MDIIQALRDSGCTHQIDTYRDAMTLCSVIVHNRNRLWTVDDLDEFMGSIELNRVLLEILEDCNG